MLKRGLTMRHCNLLAGKGALSRGILSFCSGVWLSCCSLVTLVQTLVHRGRAEGVHDCSVHLLGQDNINKQTPKVVKEARDDP